MIIGLKRRRLPRRGAGRQRVLPAGRIRFGPSRSWRTFHWHRPDAQVAALLVRPRAAAPPRLGDIARRLVVEPGGFHVTAPPGGDRLDRLLAPLTIDIGRDARGDLFLVHGPGRQARLPRVGLASAPADLVLEVSGVGGLTVHGAVLAVSTGPETRLSIRGALGTDEIVERLASTGGLDASGARRLVAAALGATVATLPARVPVAIEARARSAR